MGFGQLSNYSWQVVRLRIINKITPSDDDYYYATLSSKSTRTFVGDLRRKLEASLWIREKQWAFWDDDEIETATRKRSATRVAKQTNLSQHKPTRWVCYQRSASDNYLNSNRIIPDTIMTVAMEPSPGSLSRGLIITDLSQSERWSYPLFIELQSEPTGAKPTWRPN